MSDYSDEDFEMSNSGTVGAFNPSKPPAGAAASKPLGRAAANASPFKNSSKVGGGGRGGGGDF